MKTAILFGGLESSYYPELLFEALQEGRRLLIIDTPLNRRGDQHIINKTIDSESIADIFLVRANDIQRIKEKIEQWDKKYNIDFSFNITEEFLVASAICNVFFGWKGPGLFASYISSDKSLQRALLADIGPKKYNLHDLFDNSEFNDYPLVIKPINMHGGMGFNIIESKEDLKNYKNFHSDDYVVESYIEGTDCSVEAIVADGDIKFQAVTEEVSLPKPLDFLEMGYYQPSISFSDTTIEKLKEINKKLISMVRFENGVLHSEYRILKNGNIVFIEFAARPPGDSVLAMYNISTGHSLEKQVLNAIRGRKVDYFDSKRYVGQNFLSHKTGILKGISLPKKELGSAVNYYLESHERARVDSKYKDNEAVHQINVLYKKGDKIGPLKHSQCRVASTIYSASSKEAFKKFKTNIVDNIHVDVE